MARWFSTIAASAAAARRSLLWRSTSSPQQTICSEVVLSGTGLHSGAISTVRLLPAAAGEGRYFIVKQGEGKDVGVRVPATVDYVVESPLCTTLKAGGAQVRSVEHLLSALEGAGVDNCGIEINGGDEVPLLDGSAKEWIKAIKEAGLCFSKDCNGKIKDKLALFLEESIPMQKGDSFIVAFPSSKVQITYGIDFPNVPSIGRQWFSFSMDEATYSQEIALARTFCIYEEVEKLRSAGLIQGGTLDSAIVCSATAGWLNPPLRFHDEACRHKALDLVGDLSLLARDGSQGLPIAHIVAYKAGHSLHTQFARFLSKSS